MAWTEELKKQVVEQYQAAEPTPETSTEIIKEIAEEHEQSPNGVRMILIQAGVYVKKEQSKVEETKTAKKATGGRVSKESAIGDLKAAIKARGKTVDDDILDKLTGKAAVYLTEVLS